MLLLKVPVTRACHMEGEPGKGQNQLWTDTERAHCPLCPIPHLKQRAHVITHDCPVSLVCALIHIPTGTPPSPAGGCRQTLPCAHPSWASFLLLPQSYVTGLTLGVWTVTSF